MALNFSTNGSTGITRPPRIVTTTDDVSGCPAARAAGTPICSTTIVMASPGYMIIEGRIIRQCGVGGGRCDTYLYLDGSIVGRFIDYCDADTSEWVQHVHSWAGSLAAGTHTIYIAPSCANSMGCTAAWGHLQFLVFE